MKIASAKKRITPESRFLPCYLCGHAIRTGQSKGIMDELNTEALVLKDEKTILIFVSFDLIGMDRDHNEALRNKIAAKYNVPFENINIAFVHTHSAPEYTEHPFFGNEIKAVPGYEEFVESQIMAAIDECFDQNFVDVDAYMKTASADGFYSNRNGLEKVGDTTVRTVRFVKEDGTTAGGFLNFTCHSTVLGPQNYFVSSDLAGWLNRGVQARWGVAPVTMIGAAGDMSNRQLRQGNDYFELKRVGDGILSRLDEAKEEKISLGPIAVHTVHYAKEWNLDPEKKRQQVEVIEERLKNAKNFDEKKVYTSALAGAKASLNHLHGQIDCQSLLYRFGDIFICSIPAELFSCFGLEIKKEMATVCPIVWGYSNYSVGYLADRAEYGSSFETAASEIPEGTTEEIVEGIVSEIHRMRGI